MAITTLQFTPYFWRRSGQISQKQQDELAKILSKLLYGIVSSKKLDDASFGYYPWTRTFIDSYLGDLAGHVLQCLVAEPTHQSKSYWNEESLSEKAVRILTIQLFRLLIKSSPSNSKAGMLFDLSNVVDLVIAYGSDYPKTTADTVAEFFSGESPRLLALYEDDLVSSLKKSLSDVAESSHSSSISACKTIHIVSHVLKSMVPGDQGRPLAMAFAGDTEFIEVMGMAYGTCHHNHSMHNSSPANLDGQRWFRAKIELVDSLHALVNYCLQNDLKNCDILIGIFTTLLKYDHSPNTHSVSSPTSMTPLNSPNMLQDYEYVFTISQVLTDRFGVEHRDSRVYPIIVSLRELVPEQTKRKTAGPWLTPFIKDRETSSKSHVSGPYYLFESKNDPSRETIKRDEKGKGKAVEFEPPSERDVVSDIDLAVSQILDIFPDQPVETIRRFLQHPLFQGDTEKVIAALLEGNLPPDLLIDQSSERKAIYPSASDPEFKYTKNRYNIWDDAPMDESQLRFGKARNDTDNLLSDRSFMDQMKAEILRRVQEFSEDEEEAENERVKGKVLPGPTFLDDIEDEDAVKVVGDGEATSDSDSVDEDDGNPAAPAPETILEMAYIDNPRLFDRDAATRRSKARADIKAQTGWVDEQIEGWKIMFERNPKKDKILLKHEFSGNKSILAETSSIKPSSGQVSESGQQGSGAGRGHRGRGGGSGRATEHQQGEASSSRDNARKDKNKARMANHNRKRGHDKKMARGFSGFVE